MAAHVGAPALWSPLVQAGETNPGYRTVINLGKFWVVLHPLQTALTRFYHKLNIRHYSIKLSVRFSSPNIDMHCCGEWILGNPKMPFQTDQILVRTFGAPKSAFIMSHFEEISKKPKFYDRAIDFGISQNPLATAVSWEVRSSDD